MVIGNSLFKLQLWYLHRIHCDNVNVTLNASMLRDIIALKISLLIDSHTYSYKHIYIFLKV